MNYWQTSPHGRSMRPVTATELFNDTAEQAALVPVNTTAWPAPYRDPEAYAEFERQQKETADREWQKRMRKAAGLPCEPEQFPDSYQSRLAQTLLSDIPFWRPILSRVLGIEVRT